MKRILIILMLMFSTMSAFGQVKENISLGGMFSEGNTGSFSVNTLSTFSNDSAKFMNWSVSPYFLLNEVKSGNSYIMKQRESYLTTSFDHSIEKWKIYIFSDIENSYQKKFDIRASLGLGAGRKVVDVKNVSLSASCAIMPEYFRTVLSKEEESLRLSIRLHLETKGRLKFNSIDLIQPAIAMMPVISLNNNFNFRSTNTLSYAITKNLSVGMQVTVATSTLSSFLDARVKPTDVMTSFAISFKNF